MSNNTFTLRKAERKKAKIRLGLSAVAGGGKTMSALLIAFGITADWSKIGVIDTENQSADLYCHLGDYQVLSLSSPYSPERYIQAIRACEEAGMEVIIIDSITHEWDGKGGCLEIVDSLGGKFADWAKVTPRHQAFLDAILQSKCHVITTVRRKQEYEVIKDGNKTKVEKAGTKEITREGFEYELTVNLELDQRHNATASKDRTGLFMGKPAFVPDASTGRMIYEWCESGATPTPVQLPAISDEQFFKAKQRLGTGEIDVYEKIIAAFTLTSSQLNELDDLLKTQKEKQNGSK
ncbi:AAA family ATPase [Chitinophaga sp.]|uniref:AAA family ATPase n=1 Tax=Chitinophaga sp. TaxID=1869181 RepID=UPI0031D54086